MPNTANVPALFTSETVSTKLLLLLLLLPFDVDEEEEEEEEEEEGVFDWVETPATPPPLVRPQDMGKEQPDKSDEDAEEGDDDEEEEEEGVCDDFPPAATEDVGTDGVCSMFTASSGRPT